MSKNFKQQGKQITKGYNRDFKKKFDKTKPKEKEFDASIEVRNGDVSHLPERADITYFMSHPCHPPIWNNENTTDERRDYFGGISADQGIVNVLIQGPEEHYEVGNSVGKAIYAPVVRSHRVTLKQFALLEPGLSETVNGSLMKVLRMAMDEVVKKGVSYDCARDFLLGHMNIMGAVMFDQHQGVFSDAANKAIEFGIPVLMKDDWLRCFDDDEIAASVNRIT